MESQKQINEPTKQKETHHRENWCLSDGKMVGGLGVSGEKINKCNLAIKNSHRDIKYSNREYNQ